MNWIVSNWYIVAAILCVIAGIIVAVMKFFKLPSDKKIQNIKEWLCYAVIEAEKALGEKTGQLKLHMVYDMAIKQFPWIVTCVSFETFSLWVDEALEWMRTQLDVNKAAMNYVKGE